MKIKQFTFACLTFFSILVFFSCSEDPIIPDVFVAEGTEDYFKESMEFPSTGGSKILSFTSNVEWSLAVSETQSSTDWCIVSQTEGLAGTFNISVTVRKNEEYGDRSVVLVFTAGGMRKSILVNQKQNDVVKLTANRFEVGNEGGTIDIEVKANVDYSIEIPDAYRSWISQASKTRALSTKSLSFNIAENQEYDRREGEIIFKYNDISETFKVYQSGGAVLVLSQDAYNIEGDATTISVQLKSNIDYTFSISCDWISEVSTRALTSSTRNFNIAPNKSGNNRTGKILFTSSDGKRTAVVTVTQATLVEAQSLTITPSGPYYMTGVDDVLLEVNSQKTFVVSCYPSNAAVDYEWSSSDPSLLTVNGYGSSATINVIGFGKPKVIVKEKNSGVTAERVIQATVSGFQFSDTGEKYSVFPQLTIAVGETAKLEYTTYQGSNIPNLFGDIDKCWNIYEPYIVDKPSTFTIDANGNITGIKAGITGIGSMGGFIQKSGGNNDRIYVKVVNEYEENEYNNDFSYANTIKPNQKMKFRLSSSGDVDVFKFTRPAQYFYVKVTYEGDLGTSTGSRILSYDLYNSSYSEFGAGNLPFNASGGEYSQYRWINTTQGYIRFYMRDENKTYFTPNGYFIVEFITEEY